MLLNLFLFNRTYSTELFKAKANYEEVQVGGKKNFLKKIIFGWEIPCFWILNLFQNQLDGVRKENKGLSNEIKDIMDQIGEGGRNIHEVRTYKNWF